MKARKFYWDNDWLDGTPQNLIQARDIIIEPTPDIIENYQFSDTILNPILEKIAEHLDQNHKIAICGDYDVDGTTATAILYRVLETLGADVDYYIPNRFADGYGINEMIVDTFISQGAKLILTVDNGIVATEAVAYAQQQGLDVIITDHHGLAETLPPTQYILHTELDETFTEKAICGAAVSFLLAKALLKKYHVVDAELAELMLQLAALGTLADMMPLHLPFNRALAYLGFKSLEKSPLFLIRQLNLILGNDQLTSDDLSFQIIPCINAVGRMDDANQVVAALLSQDLIATEDYARIFIAFNEERKAVTNQMVLEAEAQIQEQITEARGFLLGIGKSWHQGILGIVAQRLMQKYQRPCILLTSSENDDELYTGSARAFAAFSMNDCFEYLAPALDKFGGHQHAGGLSVRKENLELLQKRLKAYNEKISQELDETDVTMHLQIDAWLPLKELNQNFIRVQDKYAPFGEMNKKFVIGIKQVKLVDIQELGKTKQHVKLTVTEENKKYQIVAFQSYELLADVARFATVDLALECQLNHFNGRTTVQYLLLDIRPPQKQIFDWRNIQYLQVQDLELSDTTAIYLEEIPLNSQEFLTLIQQERVTKLYIKPLLHEAQLLYAKKLDERYFNYIYKYVFSKKTLDLGNEQMYDELAQKKIPKSVFLYVIRVFFELDFVIIKENLCKITKNVEKTTLANSQAYQDMETWLSFRSLLLTGSVDSLYEALFDF